MSIQPTHVTTLEVVEHLDFTPTLPCEHSQHGNHPAHSGPAHFIIDSGCTRCAGLTRLLICESGWAKTRILFCVDCGMDNMPRDVVWRIVGVVGGAS